MIQGGRGQEAAATAAAPVPEAIDTAAEDAGWVVLAQGGDRAAQETLFRRHLARTRQRVLRLLGPDAEVDDVVQESFIEAFEGLRKLQDPRAFASWILTIAVHRVSRRLRRRRMLKRLGFMSGGDRPELVETVASPALSTAQAAEARSVYEWLGTLPAQVRVAFLLRHLEGLTVPEVAAQMGLSERTVKRRIALAESYVSTVLALEKAGPS